jgi:polysaccharide pyruvyl transferase WcaK-like protein
MTETRRIAFYGFLGSGNLGNDASLEAVLAWFQERYPQLRLSCITLAPEVIQDRYGLPAVPLAYGGRTAGSSIGSTLLKVFGRLVDVPRSLRLAGQADAVVVPGMGVLEEQLGVRPWGLPAWMFLMAAACRIRRTPFVLLSVGAEPVRNPFTRKLFGWTVRLAADVSYRDDWSFQAMRNAGRRDPEPIAPDVAFAHPATAAAIAQPGLVAVGVMAYYGRLDDPVRGANLRQDYIATLTKALVQLVDQGDRLLLLGGDRVDFDVAQEVKAAVLAARANQPAGTVVVRDVQRFDELVGLLAGAEVVVASRFHNLICALKVGRPVVSVGYAPKNARLMAELGLADYCQEIEHLDADRLLEQLRQARAQRHALAAAINEKTYGYQAAVRSLLDRTATETLHLSGAESRARD